MASAYAAAFRILGSKGSVVEALHEQISQLDKPADRALCTAIVNGVTKHRRTLDWELSKLANKFRHNSHPVRNALRLGLFVIRNLDSIPDYAAVSQAVNLARKSRQKGAGGFVNAILRNAIRKGRPDWPDRKTGLATHLGVHYSMPDWLISKWLRDHGAKWTEKACVAFNMPAPVTVRAEGGSTVEGLNRALNEEGITSQPCRFSDEALHIRTSHGLHNVSAFQKGLCTAQDEANILLGKFALTDADYFVDLCAAPGGKFTYLAQHAKKALANDIDPERLALVKENCLRLGINAEFSVFDATRDDPGIQADLVSLDVPCTGTGTLRRRPDLRWEKHQADFDVLVPLQARLLEHASGLVKPGGFLVYSTCSVEPEENMEQIERFLESHKKFKKVPGSVPENGFLSDSCFDTSSYIDFMDGVFACRMKKTS